LRIKSEKMLLVKKQSLVTTTTRTRTHKKFSCSRCLKVFMNKSNYESHEGSAIFQCRLCSMVLCSQKDRGVHMKSKHPSQVISKICSTTSSSKSSNTSKNVKTKVQCEVCHNFLSSNYSYQRHFKSLHSSKKNEKLTCGKNIDILNIEKDVYKCIFCHEKFYRKAEFDSHLKKHYGSQDTSDKSNSLPARSDNNLEVKVYANPQECSSELRQNLCGNNNKELHENPSNNLEQFNCEVRLERCDDPNSGSARKTVPSEFQYFQCKRCTKSFRDISKWYKHETTRNFQCQACSKATCTKISLDLHLILAHASQIFCKTCSRLFPNEAELKLHRKTHSIKCKYCKLILSSQHHYNKHVRAEHGIKNSKTNKCDKCPKSFDKQEELAIHFKAFHAIQCKLCPKVLKTKHSHTLHMKLHAGQRAFKCTRCDDDRRFIDKAQLVKHVNIRHEKTKLFPCPECERVFYCSSTRRSHLVGAHREKQFSCETCGKTFSTKFNLRSHQQMHIYESIECPTCKKTFKNPNSLKIHIRLAHDRIKETFECPICAKLVSKTYLNTHLQLHTGERPYQCKLCGDTFKLQAHLSSHCMKHTKERPHKCTICKKTFIHIHHLTNHLRSAHDLEKTLSISKIESNASVKVS
jgi:KRAB domain-containing zinc finger protein